MCDKAGCSKTPVVVTLSDSQCLCIDHTLAIFNPAVTDRMMGHSVPRGKSLVEKIRNDLDTVFADPDKEFNGKEFADVADDMFAEGIAHALGVLRSTSADEEWDEAVNRWETKNVGASR